MQFRWLILATLSIGIHLSAKAAEWTHIFTAKNGTRWLITDTAQLQDGSIRTWMKSQRGNRSSAPFAILLKCETKEGRDFQPGELGSEFLNPWIPIAPDSAGEIAFNALCRAPKRSNSVPNAQSEPRPGEPSGVYAGRIRARIKPNLVFDGAVDGNPIAEVEVKCASDGTIVARKLLKSSGNRAWDEAVLRAVDRTEVLPRDLDGKVPQSLLISFRPKD